MTAPDAGQMHVATEALRGEAGVWDTQAAALGGLQATLSGLSLTRLQAGIFQVVFESYDRLLGQVADRVAEGANSMGEIGPTLRQVADTYECQEATHVHALRNLY